MEVDPPMVPEARGGVGDDLMIDVPEAGGDAAASAFAIVL
jgi:hypothetical protein